MEILKVKNLTKIYESINNKVVALNNISFSVNKGEFLIIIGPSGSGKSTLLHLIGGLDKPTSGDIIINNVAINDLNNDEMSIFRRKNIGIIYQFYNLLSILTVEENIKLPLELDNKKIDNDFYYELLKYLDLDTRKRSLPFELSGGQQQKVSIARALITKPFLILADEPTGNLDSKAGKEIVKLLKSICKKYRQTIIMITHNLDLISVADRVITIEDGKIVKEETNENIKENSF